jgi:hypothetical protein
MFSMCSVGTTRTWPALFGHHIAFTNAHVRSSRYTTSVWVFHSFSSPLRI